LKQKERKSSRLFIIFLCSLQESQADRMISQSSCELSGLTKPFFLISKKNSKRSIYQSRALKMGRLRRIASRRRAKARKLYSFLILCFFLIKEKERQNLTA